ncbi:hypothetical protein HKD37_12G032883 [Glycine soja]
MGEGELANSHAVVIDLQCVVILHFPTPLFVVGCGKSNNVTPRVGAHMDKDRNFDALIAETQVRVKGLIGNSVVVPAEEHGYAASEDVEARLLLLCNQIASFSKACFPARLGESHA